MKFHKGEMLSNFEIEGCLAAKQCFLKVGSETAVGTLLGRLLEVKMGVRTGENGVWRRPGGLPRASGGLPARREDGGHHFFRILEIFF